MFSQILILYILLQSTLNSESSPCRLLQKIYNSMKPMSGRLCCGCGAYGWTLPDASQTYFILWDIIDLQSPQIGAKTQFPCVFLLPIKVCIFLKGGIDDMRDKYDDTDAPVDQMAF